MAHINKQQMSIFIYLRLVAIKVVLHVLFILFMTREFLHTFDFWANEGPISIHREKICFAVHSLYLA